MADNYGGPFGSYPPVTGVVSAGAQAEIQALLDELRTYLPVPDEGEAGENISSPHPDFDQIPPQTREKLRVEIQGVDDAIAAAPTA